MPLWRRSRPASKCNGAGGTTVATLTAFAGVRGKAELAENRAVYHDLTREALRARGYDGPISTPEEAAEHLIGIVQSNAEGERIDQLALAVID